MAATTLDDRFNSRMVLGLGTSTPHAVVNIHGMTFEQPVRRAHETIEVIRRLLGEADTPSTCEGDLLSIENVPRLDGKRIVLFTFTALGASI